jgi:hypothetical protein
VAESVDPASDDNAKQMTQELSGAIRRTLAESPAIAQCLNRMRAEGYEVSLTLEATIGFLKRGGPDGSENTDFDFRVERSEPAPLKMTPLDRKFLRSLKISVDDDE